MAEPVVGSPKKPSAVAYSEAQGACELLANTISELEQRLELVLMSDPPQAPAEATKKVVEASPVTSHLHELTERVLGSRDALRRLMDRLDC